jgi:hypothetical protein
VRGYNQLDPIVTREDWLGDDSRPDFKVTAGRSSTYVEVKKDDSDYHLEKYAKCIHSALDSRLALLVKDISAADESKARALDWSIYYWDAFVDCLVESHPDSLLVQSYIGYIRRVCDMIELRQIKFDPDSLFSLTVLIECLSRVIPSVSHDVFRYSIARNQTGSIGNRYTTVRFQAVCVIAEGSAHVLGYCGLNWYGEKQGETTLDLFFRADEGLVNAVHDWMTPELRESGRAGLDKQGLWLNAGPDVLPRLLSAALPDQLSMLKELFRELMAPIEDAIVVMIRRKASPSMT